MIESVTILSMTGLTVVSSGIAAWNRQVKPVLVMWVLMYLFAAVVVHL